MIYHVTSQVGGGATASLRTGWGAPRSPHVAGRVRVCVAAAGVVCCLAAGCTSSDDHGGSTPQLSPIDRLVEKYRADGRDVQCVVAQLERLDEAEHGFIAVQREHATAQAAPPGPPGPRPPSIRHISV